MRRIAPREPRVAALLRWSVVLLLAGLAATMAWTLAIADSADSSLALVSAPPLPAGASLPRVGGYIQAREVAQEHVGVTAVLNRARFSIDGALPSKFSYRALVEMEASAGTRSPATVSLREAIGRWAPAPFAVTAGEFKTPFTREYLIAIPALELADLATAIDSLAPKYDVGVMGELSLGASAGLALGVFNGEGANAIANRDSTVMIVSRATARAGAGTVLRLRPRTPRPCRARRPGSGPARRILLACVVTSTSAAKAPRWSRVAPSSRHAPVAATRATPRSSSSGTRSSSGSRPARATPRRTEACSSRWCATPERRLRLPRVPRRPS